MRFFFLVILLAGLALGIGYPLAVQNVSGYEIGTFRLFDEQGFRPADVSLAPSEAPVRVRVALEVSQRIVPAADKPIFELSVQSGERLVLERTVTFEGVDPTATSPQGAGFVYEDDVASLDPVDGDDRYVFTLAPAIGVAVIPTRVDLILNAGAFDLDPRAVPIGYVLIVVGVVGFVAMFRRRIRKNREAPPPETPKWGRGDGGEGS